MNVCVVGTGYVGLVAGTCFSESGNDVICVDIDEDKIAALNDGKIPIYEPGLEDMVKRNVDEGRLRFITDIAEGVKKSKIIFIAVGTPQDRDGSADLSYVLQVAKQIAEHAQNRKIVVCKSTVPVGTNDKVRAVLKKHSKQKFDVVSNPEFMKEGAALADFLKPDRVVVGTDNPKAAEVMKELYSPFVRTEKPIHIMGVRSAEMTKYAANALLATKISFMNEIANLCDKVGADVEEVRKGVGSDSRIGFQFLFPGVGYGGSCFPKDVRALMRTADDNGAKLTIIKQVDVVNERQKSLMLQKVLDHFKDDLKGKVIAIWGLAFKPQTDDMREAPAIPIIRGLLRRGAIINAYDPVASENAEKIFGKKVRLYDSSYDALHDAEALIVVTEWHEFRRPNYEKIKKLMKKPTIFDGRNVYTPARVREEGFAYYSVGRDKP